MNPSRSALVCALLVLVGTLAILATVHPAQARTASPAPVEPLTRVPAPRDAATTLTQTQPGPRFGHTLTRVGDAIYLFGGATTLEPDETGRMPLGEVLNDLWEYNLSNNVWREIEPQGERPEARYSHAATTAVGEEAVTKFFLLSGLLSGDYEVRDQWFYTPIVNAWQRVIPENEAPNAMAGHSAVTRDDGAPIIFGGASLGGTYFETRMWTYYPDINRYWSTELYNSKLPRKWHSAMTIGKLGHQFMIVISGADPTGKLLDDVWLYDFQSRIWIPVWPPTLATASDGRESFAGPTGRAQMAGVAYGSRALILGGMDESGAGLDEVWEFDAATSSWRALPPLPAPRRMAAAAVLEERADQVDVLIFGGISGGEVISETLVYTVDVPQAHKIFLPLVVRH